MKKENAFLQKLDNEVLHDLVLDLSVFIPIRLHEPDISVLPVGSAFASRDIHRPPQLLSLIITYLLHIYM